MLRPEIADEKGIIFVCPDGKDSWYWDSPKNPAYRYETFVSSELVNYIDRNYKTIADRKGRAITGLSMGGHGAMWLGIRHKDVFGAAGSGNTNKSRQAKNKFLLDRKSTRLNSSH